ncbi:ribonuclease H-like domain-containing protein [Lactifluus volemus]|nr:ribonuclease H-like domain-containing protein [Lactifluus volemus]
MFVANNFSWNSVNNPEFVKWVTKWIPGAVVPDRRTLSGPILDRQSQRVEIQMRDKLNGKLATGQCDGWKNAAKASVVAMMVTVDSEPHLIKTHDVSAEAKTGENLLKLMLEDITYAQVAFGLLLIAFCCDDGGDARKFRRLLLALMPWLIVTVCWAHQINLIVGNFLSLKIDLLKCIPTALEVIKWFNNHSCANGILQTEQLSVPNGKALILVLPVITRWTAHYLSLRRLLQVKGPLKACYNKYAPVLLLCAGLKAEAKRKAEEVQEIVEDSSFWKDVRKVVTYLHPLAVANFITQSSDTGLHHILLTLGNLYHIYSDPKLDEADVFIAAVVLNPYIRNRWFATGVQKLTPVGLLGIVKRVCARVFREEPEIEFSEAFMDYLQQRGEFSDEWMQLSMWTDMFEKQKRKVNLVRVWEGMDTQIPAGQKQGRNRLVKLAVHILSIVANSAGCERVFSEMGIVQTKHRSRLGLDKVRKTALIRMDIK